MEIVSTFRFWENYIIDPKYQRLRWQESKDSVSVFVPEVTGSDAPAVFRVYDLCKQTGNTESEDIRIFRGKLYRRAYSHDYSTTTEHELWSKEKMANSIATKCKWGCNPYRADEGSYGQAIQEIREFAARFLLVDGVVYHRTGEPMYVIHTRDTDNNQDGTHIAITNRYSDDVPAHQYFSALEKTRAVQAAKAMSFARGDTDSLARIDDESSRLHIEVFDRTAVRRRPAVDLAYSYSPLPQKQKETTIHNRSNKRDVALSGRVLAMQGAR